MDEAALLAAIEAAPDDDGPRLVLADLLQQRGDAWGEIIVLGCELARREEPALRQRHAQLVGERFDVPGVYHLFERGFCAQLSSNELARAAGPHHALLREATLDDAIDDSLAALVGWPLLARIERLELDAARFRSGLGRHVPPIVAAARRLRALELMRMDLSRGDLEAILAVPHAAQLVRLYISSNSPLAGALHELAWPALAELELGACDLHGSDVAALFAGERLRGLRALALSYNDIADDGAVALAAQPFTQLARLELEGNELTPRGIALLAESPHLRGLRMLAIGGGFDTDIDGALPALSTAFPALETLRIESRSLLPSLPALARPLHELRLHLAEIEPAVLATLLECRAVRTLRRLDLAERDGTRGDALAAVIAAAELPVLAWLSFRSAISPTGVRTLARAPHLPASCHLMLSTDADVSELRARYASVYAS